MKTVNWLRLINRPAACRIHECQSPAGSLRGEVAQRNVQCSCPHSTANWYQQRHTYTQPE